MYMIFKLLLEKFTLSILNISNKGTRYHLESLERDNYLYTSYTIDKPTIIQN